MICSNGQPIDNMIHMLLAGHAKTAKCRKKNTDSCARSFKLITYQCLIDFMSLSNFEIAVGGITSIPVLGGLVFLGYKSWGEKNLDASKLKPKKAVAKKKDPTPKPATAEKPVKKDEVSAKVEKTAKTASQTNAEPKAT